MAEVEEVVKEKKGSEEIMAKVNIITIMDMVDNDFYHPGTTSFICLYLNDHNPS